METKITLAVPGNGGTTPNNGSDNNGLDLIGLYRQGPRAITAEIKKQLLSLTLFAFIEVFGLAKLGRLRKKRSPVTADNEVRHLETVASHWPGLRTIPIGQLEDVDIGEMCDIINTAINPESGEQYKTNSFNAYVGAVGREIGFLGGPPFRLLPKSKVDELQSMIEFGNPDSVAECPLPTPDEEALLIQYVQQRCGREAAQEPHCLLALLLLWRSPEHGQEDRSSRCHAGTVADKVDV